MRIIGRVVLLLMLAISAASAIAAESTVFGAITPEFELADRDGEHVSLEQFRGRNVLLTFGVTKSAENYTVQHAPSIFLIGPIGDLLDVFAMNSPSADIAELMQ